MTSIQPNWLVFLLVLSTALFSCQSTTPRDNNSNKKSKVNSSNSEPTPVQLIDNKGVRFEYALEDNVKSGEKTIIPIECLIINETKKEILYLNESCNGLEYFLVVSPNSYKVEPLKHCRATWPKISSLGPNDSLRFKTQLSYLKDASPIVKIGLDFRAVDKYVDFETLQKNPKLVQSLYPQEAPLKNIIWGNNILKN